MNQEAEVAVSQDHTTGSLYSSLGNRARLRLKKKKISRVWWHVPVVPATQEAGAGSAGCGKLRSSHYTPAWVTERDSVSKKKKKILFKYKNVHFVPSQTF